MIKKMFLALLLVLSLSSCSLLNNESESVESSTPSVDVSNHLCGIFVTIMDENDNYLYDSEFSASSLLTTYATVEHGESSMATCYYGPGTYLGANVIDVKKNGNDETLELETNLTYTPKLFGCIVTLWYVYYDEELDEITCEVGHSAMLNDVSSSTLSMRQDLTWNSTDEDGNVITGSYNAYVGLEFHYVDYLSQVRVLEYNANNVMINTGTVSDTYEYETLLSTEYVILEKTYDVMDSEGVVSDSYIEREIVSRSEKKASRTIQVPDENGLNKNVDYKIIFADSSTGSLL